MEEFWGKCRWGVFRVYLYFNQSHHSSSTWEGDSFKRGSAWDPHLLVRRQVGIFIQWQQWTSICDSSNRRRRIDSLFGYGCHWKGPIANSQVVLLGKEIGREGLCSRDWRERDRSRSGENVYCTRSDMEEAGGTPSLPTWTPIKGVHLWNPFSWQVIRTQLKNSLLYTNTAVRTLSPQHQLQEFCCLRFRGSLLQVDLDTSTAFLGNRTCWGIDRYHAERLRRTTEEHSPSNRPRR